MATCIATRGDNLADLMRDLPPGGLLVTRAATYRITETVVIDQGKGIDTRGSHIVKTKGDHVGFWVKEDAGSHLTFGSWEIEADDGGY